MIIGRNIRINFTFVTLQPSTSSDQPVDAASLKTLLHFSETNYNVHFYKSPKYGGIEFTESTPPEDLVGSWVLMQTNQYIAISLVVAV